MCAIHLALTQMFSKGSAVLLYSQNETETNELSAGYEISLMNLRMILHTGFCSGMVRTRLNRLIRELRELQEGNASGVWQRFLERNVFTLFAIRSRSYS